MIVPTARAARGRPACVASAPYVVTWLTAQTANNTAPAIYLIIAAVISLGTVLTLRETAARPLPQTSAVTVST